MALEQTSWRKLTAEPQNNPDYVSFYPREGIAISYNWSGLGGQKYLVWGGWYEEAENGIVFFSLMEPRIWKEQSYEICENLLRWSTPHGTVEYQLVSDHEIPEDARQKALERVAVLNSERRPDRT